MDSDQNTTCTLQSAYEAGRTAALNLQPLPDGNAYPPDELKELNRGYRDGEIERFDRHMRILKGRESSSTGRYRAHVAEFLAWRDGNGLTTHPTSVEPVELRKEVEEYLTWCYRKGNGNATRLGKLVAVRNYFRFLTYNGLMAQDPTEKIPSPPPDSAELIPFTRDEVLRLFREIDLSTEKGLRDAVFLILGVFAGFRVSEIRKFNIEDVIDDLKHDVMNLSVVKSKRGRSRIVWIWKAPAHYVRALLLARVSQGAKEGDPLLVSYKKNGRPRGNRRLTNDACDDIIKKIAKKAGIRRRRIKTHQLRATHACDARSIKGYDVFTIMERFGWKQLETAARYVNRREPVHRTYNNWHEYWIDFTKVWSKKITTEGAEKVEVVHAG